MKPYLNPPRILAALAAVPLLLGSFAGQASAQTKLVDWPQTWNYMHPTAGVLPPGSGATEPNSGATKWYADEATFAASYAGPSFTTGVAGSYDAGAGPGPLGYSTVDYFNNPLPPPAEIAALGTTLTDPGANRYTGYFRTTFTVPSDGNFYVNPVLRYILDDGGFVYLDGVLVLKVNMGAVNDTYTGVAASTTATESHIRDAALSLNAGSTTGGNTAVAPAIAGNANVISRVTSLAAGVHTLAISVHNQAAGSSDIDMAIQLVATPTTASIAGGFNTLTRGPGTLPLDPSDDTVSFKINVAGVGAVAPAGWTITSPASLVGTTGAYNTDVAVNNIPIANFGTDSQTAPTAPTPMTITIADAATPAVTTTINVLPPRIMVSDDHAGTNIPIATLGNNPNVGWVYDDTARTLFMRNGGGGSRKVVTSQVIDLSAVGAVQFTGALDVHDYSTGFEGPDTFVAYLIIDGNTAAPVNLITAYDTITVNGVLEDDELAPTGATTPGTADFTYNFTHLIAASANSVQVVIEGVTDSNNEQMTVRGLKITSPPAGIVATVGAVTVNNLGTDSALDDTFGAPVTIEAVSLGASPGWTSNTTPATGLYTDPQPVLFQGYSVGSGAVTFNLTDIANPAVTAPVTLTPPTPTLVVTGPTNILRIENGPGNADDTVTFNANITGANGGPRWSTSTAGVTPVSGSFGAVTFTVGAPLPGGTLAVVVSDVSYPAAAQTINVPIPGRYVIGRSDVTGTMVDVATPLTPAAPAEYINDPVARTLEVNNAGTPEKVLESEVINLTGIGPVQFSGKFRATDSSAGSNFETPDKVKAELVYEVAGVPTTINLLSTWDVGDGAASAGVNGPPDGYINGFSGIDLNDYNANLVRDEFNKNSQTGDISMDATFDLAASIPAEADNVKLKLYVVSVGAAAPSERVYFTDILFTTGVAPVDTDADGMTDAYEDANGLDKNNPADKLTDLDGDGQSNYAEFLAGTAANNPGSTLRITDIVPTATPGTYNVSIATVAGKRYQLEESTDNGVTDVWAAVPGGPVTAAGPVTTVPIPIGGLGPRHFLRAKVVP